MMENFKLEFLNVVNILYVYESIIVILLILTLCTPSFATGFEKYSELYSNSILSSRYDTILTANLVTKVCNVS